MKQLVSLTLIIIIPIKTANVIKRVSTEDDSHITCFETDTIPVSVDEIFENNCKDLRGNQYQENSLLTSCCECISYTCKHFDNHSINMFFMWNVSASEQCCQHCDGVIYKAGSVIETIQHEDECRTSETSVCRVLPDKASAAIEIEFKYKHCCDDGSGLNKLNATKLEPSTCSRRTCYFANSLPYSSWVSSKIHEGCDCCELNGELVKDGYTWTKDNQIYECCRGEIVVKLQTPPITTTITTTTKESTTSRPTTTTKRSTTTRPTSTAKRPTTPTQTATTPTPPTTTTPPATKTTPPTTIYGNGGGYHTCGGNSRPTSYPTTPKGCFLSNTKAIPIDTTNSIKVCDKTAFSPEDCQYISQRTYYGKLFVYDNKEKRCTVWILRRGGYDEGQALITEAPGFISGLQFCSMNHDEYFVPPRTTISPTTTTTF